MQTYLLCVLSLAYIGILKGQWLGNLHFAEDGEGAASMHADSITTSRTMRKGTACKD